MMSGHLSDEAVAAFADGVLTGHARGRASRHTGECAECATAVRVQREAAFALRAAPAPALPTDLFDRLRGLPQVTPIERPATVVLPDGSRMLSTAGRIAPLAALVPPEAPPARGPHRPHAFSATAALVVLAGALATGAAADRAEPARPGTVNTVNTVRTADDRPGSGTVRIEPVSAWTQTGLFQRGDR